jgi:hypothetical protein
MPLHFRNHTRPRINPRPVSSTGNWHWHWRWSAGIDVPVVTGAPVEKNPFMGGQQDQGGQQGVRVRGILLLLVSFSSYPCCTLMPIAFFSFSILIFSLPAESDQVPPPTNAQGHHVYRQFKLPGTRTVNVLSREVGSRSGA